jgi:CBS domain-containing protein
MPIVGFIDVSSSEMHVFVWRSLAKAAGRGNAARHLIDPSRIGRGRRRTFANGVTFRPERTTRRAYADRGPREKFTQHEFGGTMSGKNIGSVLQSKEIQELVSVSPTATVADAAALMSRRGVGAVMVTSATGKVEGIFTERDIVRRVVDEGRDPTTTPMSAVMSAEVRRVAASATVEEALRLMIVHRHRHLLVEEGDQVKGLVSIRDLMYWMVLPDEPIAHEGRVGVIRARAEDAVNTVRGASKETPSR